MNWGVILAWSLQWVLLYTNEVDLCEGEGLRRLSQYRYVSTYGYGMICLLAIVLIACSLEGVLGCVTRARPFGSVVFS